MNIRKVKIDEQFMKKYKFGKYEKEINEVHKQLRILKDDEVLEIKDVNDKLINAIRISIKSTSPFSKGIDKIFTTRCENNNMYIKIK